MSDPQLSTLQQEWTTLQNQSDSYEKHALFIKLFNVLLTCTLLFVFNTACWAVFICAVLWLQDGIWKTFQSRMAQRIEIVEATISTLLQGQTVNVLGMQFNSQWNESRPSAVGLVFEYIKNSLKPTVAYPHVILILVSTYYWFA